MQRVHILAERMAALLEGHESGWRLPQHSALARRYNVSVPEVEAAIAELAARHLLRRLPDGRVYRASPAEYLISLGGDPGLTSQIDPMGSEIACESRHVSWRRVPEHISWALGAGPRDEVCVIRDVWTANGERAALSTTYLPGQVAAKMPGLHCPWPAATPPPGGSLPGESDPSPSPAPPALPAGDRPSLAALLNVVPFLAPAEPDMLAYAPADGRSAGGATRAAAGMQAFRPRALYLEMQPPPPSAARSLRLAHGAPAMLVSVGFDDPVLGTPAALTVAVLRPELFRIVVTSAATQRPDGHQDMLAGAWAHVLEDRQPDPDMP